MCWSGYISMVSSWQRQQCFGLKYSGTWQNSWSHPSTQELLNHQPQCSPKTLRAFPYTMPQFITKHNFNLILIWFLIEFTIIHVIHTYFWCFRWTRLQWNISSPPLPTCSRTSFWPLFHFFFFFYCLMGDDHLPQHPVIGPKVQKSETTSFSWTKFWSIGPRHLHTWFRPNGSLKVWAEQDKCGGTLKQMRCTHSDVLPMQCKRLLC